MRIMAKVQENKSDIFFFVQFNMKNKLDLIICEFHPNDYTDTKKYINNMILILLVVIKYVDFVACVFRVVRMSAAHSVEGLRFEG